MLGWSRETVRNGVSAFYERQPSSDTINVDSAPRSIAGSLHSGGC